MKRRAFLLAATVATLVPSAFAQGNATKIGIIGSGRIGSTFGALWAKSGHEIMFSDRDADVAKKAAEAVGSKARSGSVEQAVAFGDVVFIAVPYGALPAIAQQVGPQLKGKVVLDPNNPVPARDGDLGAQAKEKGAAVSTAALLPGARLVRAFNSWGYQTMAREANRPAQIPDWPIRLPSTTTPSPSPPRDQIKGSINDPRLPSRQYLPRHPLPARCR